MDTAVQGTDREAVEMAAHLLRADGLFLGSSAAMNCVGAVKVSLPAGPAADWEGELMPRLAGPCFGGLGHDQWTEGELGLVRADGYREGRSLPRVESLLYGGLLAANKSPGFGGGRTCQKLVRQSTSTIGWTTCDVNGKIKLVTRSFDCLVIWQRMPRTACVLACISCNVRTRVLACVCLTSRVWAPGSEAAWAGPHNSDGAVRRRPPPPQPLPQPRLPGQRGAHAAARQGRPQLCGVARAPRDLQD